MTLKEHHYDHLHSEVFLTYEHLSFTLSYNATMFVPDFQHCVPQRSSQWHSES